MGIKSFIGARKRSSATTTPSLTVSDYMSTNLITFKADQTVESVIQSLIKNRISGGPVVNRKNELVGIISEGDCIKQISESRYYNMPLQDLTIEKHMITDVETIDGDMNIFDAAKKFLDSKRRRFPIVKKGKLIGQISQKDILKAAMTMKGQTWK
ncbi:CBS domain-containing protein [Tamlana sp. 2_MG-2023]|uniref:CBS domain-containing protein n=1 Tax=unclassified Tamlana TaxID=2614803 RepID=UPI0026E2A04F|nr:MULTISPECIES: CBS domain-containing protein [unclassified Tamlana]MDO6761430.1 CBS domain-containing protein [Tamlana sp. 2_MG-2023]MDO6792126.1 CBS domain-containing protein [Tamlana sp. 1_MG-2023]